MHKYTIYRLINPVDDSPFYVGITSNNINCRLMSHISESMRKKKTDKHNVIAGIISGGLRPFIETIEDVEYETFGEVLLREQYWMKFYKDEGHPITNIYTNHKIHIRNKKQIMETTKETQRNSYETLQRIYSDIFNFIKTRRTLLETELLALTLMTHSSLESEICMRKREIRAQMAILNEMHITNVRNLNTEGVDASKN